MALEGLAKTSHATWVEASPDLSKQARRKPAAANHGAAGGPKGTVPRCKALSFCHRKGFGTGLAGKRIFHIGNAMKAPTVP